VAITAEESDTSRYPITSLTGGVDQTLGCHLAGRTGNAHNRCLLLRNPGLIVRWKLA
jgi:hypothetical protein